MSPYFIILPLLAFAVSVLATKFLLIYLRKKNILDIPNERSSHKTPTPRGGGLGIVLGTLVAVLIYIIISGEYRFLIILLAALAIAVTGLVDDLRKGLHAGLRFGIQIVCAAVVIGFFKPIEVLPFPAPLHVHLSYFGYVFAVIWLVGITNIFNFLDGIDGYAGVQGLLAGIMISLLAWGSPISITGFIIAMACAGFLFYNWHPAKIFMGDIGSSFLGFLLAALPFYISDFSYPGLRTDMFFGTGVVLWFFLLDGSFTMFRRLLKGEKIWQAHRSHLYQRLVISGMSHSDVVLTVSFFYSILFAVLLFFAAQPHNSIIKWPVLATGFALFFVYMLYVIIRERKAKREVRLDEEKNI